MSSVNPCVLASLENAQTIEVSVQRVEEAEADEMWSYVQNKENQR
ncbi:MAG: hypothetical protein AABZ60_12175 [Planctomycetota bacterium]